MTIGQKNTPTLDALIAEAYARLHLPGGERKKAPKETPEHDLQALLIAQVRTWDKARGAWVPGVLSLKYPELMDLYAVPNGGGRSKREAGRLKAEGVLAGVLDLALDVARHGETDYYSPEFDTPLFHGLRLETKVPGSYPTEEQCAYMRRLVDRGYAVAVWRTLGEGMDLLVRYVTGRWEQTSEMLK